MIRGFLVFLTLMLVLTAMVLWIALPGVAGVLVANAAKAGGLSCFSMSARVDANPPLELLAGRAEAVNVTCVDATFSNLRVADLDLTFGDVRLLDRRFGTVEGTLAGVEVIGDSTLPSSDVTLHGNASNADAEIDVPAADAAALAETRLHDLLGISVRVTALPPDNVQIAGYGVGRLAVVDGALVLQSSVPGLPTITLLEPADVNPFHLTGVSVDATSLRLTGTVDVVGMLGLPSDAPATPSSGPAISRRS